MYKLYKNDNKALYSHYMYSKEFKINLKFKIMFFIEYLLLSLVV